MSLRKLIYHPSGKAGEYADKGYAANLFKGCTHGCGYCYVPSVLRMSRNQFHRSSVAAPDVLERLTKDIDRIGIVKEPIFLCFTCDPYCEGAPTDITRQAIRIINASGNAVNILTKGGTRTCGDFDLLTTNPGNKIGATLTFSCEESSIYWEPKAAVYWDRLIMLRNAKRKGIQTWASIEPVINPQESLEIMEMAIPYVDVFKIGKWNHDKRAREINWRDFVLRAKELMERNGKRYMFKKEIRSYLANDYIKDDESRAEERTGKDKNSSERTD